jgi:phosphoribosylanthranilate isomerase
MRVKICGIRNTAELTLVVSSGADAVGFITEVPVDSPRKITLPEASMLISKVPVFVASVLVIMPENAEKAIHMIRAARPTAVQIHNTLSLRELKKIKGTGVKLIKTVPVPQNADPEALMKQIGELTGIADAVLLDTVLDGKTGGTGATHNWDISSKISLRAEMPVILAGGLNPENIVYALKSIRPYAVDTASGVETGGRKDEKKIKDFIKKARLYGI